MAHLAAWRNQETCRASCIGGIAWRVLSEGSPASIVGVTSRGVFVRTSDRWILFVTDEPYRGPLTINLPENIGSIRSLEVGSSVTMSEGRLDFCSGLHIIASGDTTALYHSIPSEAASPLSEQHDRLMYLARKALHSGRTRGFGALLPHLLDLPICATRADHEPDVLPDVLSLRQALARGDMGGSLSLMRRLLGVGRGLTPSGDDLAIGLVLLLSRWGEALGLDDSWLDLSSQIVGAAYERTTTLSANLIESASWGQSDERLVAVVDSLVTGRPAKSECVSRLFGWGSSSGIDAFVGMTVGLTGLRMDYYASRGARRGHVIV
jgi:hypothetical protein